MELRHLRYFLVLAQELHFGRAASRLAISQPPLSFNIKQLESSLGVLLFERSTRGVKLTPAGEAFRGAAARVLADVDEARELARKVARGVISRVRVGFVGSMMFRGLPEQLSRFQREHPGLEIVLNELNSAEQIDALVKGQLDLCFVHTSRIPSEFTRFTYSAERFVCCLPARHPAAKQRTVKLSGLSEEAFVMFSRGASPDYYERVLALCAEQGLQPSIRHEVRHWLSVVSLVSKGSGVAIVPQALARAGIDGVVFKSLGPSQYRSEVFCVWNEKKMPAELPALVQALEVAAARAAKQN